MCIYRYMYIHTYIYIYIYTHTYTYTYTWHTFSYIIMYYTILYDDALPRPRVSFPPIRPTTFAKSTYFANPTSCKTQAGHG